MISYIKGTIANIGDGYIILDNNGIGYRITMPVSALYNLTEGIETKIFTYMAVKEDDVSLYGFLSADDMRMFSQLITVNGIGPKAAVSILSSLTTEELILAIAASDHKLIASSKGIGSKTAQKIVVELKDRIDKTKEFQDKTIKGTSNDLETAISFVVSTGVSRSDCMKALSKADSIENEDLDGIIDIIYKNLSI